MRDKTSRLKREEILKNEPYLLPIQKEWGSLPPSTQSRHRGEREEQRDLVYRMNPHQGIPQSHVEGTRKERLFGYRKPKPEELPPPKPKTPPIEAEVEPPQKQYMVVYDHMYRSGGALRRSSGPFSEEEAEAEKKRLEDKGYRNVHTTVVKSEVEKEFRPFFLPSTSELERVKVPLSEIESASQEYASYSDAIKKLIEHLKKQGAGLFSFNQFIDFANELVEQRVLDPVEIEETDNFIGWFYRTRIIPNLGGAQDDVIGKEQQPPAWASDIAQQRYTRFDPAIQSRPLGNESPIRDPQGRRTSPVLETERASITSLPKRRSVMI